VSDRAAPGKYDEIELLAAMRAMLAAGRAGIPTEPRTGHAVYAAYVQACRDDDRHGNLAGLMLFWITGGLNTPERLDAADEILNGDGADPRQAKVFDVVHRLTAGEMTWDEFARVQKRGLIPKERPKPRVGAPDAVPLRRAKTALKEMLASSTEANRRLEASWIVFKQFAHRPVAAPRGRRIENDMCLFQWGMYDWGKGPRFECGLTRQFVLHTSEDDYDHMEQLSMTLLFDPADPAVAALGSGELWSDNDLASWITQIEALPVFAALLSSQPLKARILHENV
jgi:hypothetical protein